MFKKIMSVMLAVVMLMSVVAISASAAQVEIADNSADAAADLGADAGADVAAANVLNFDSTTAGWNNYKKVFCYIWQYGGDSFYAWQQKATQCKDDDGDGIWTYDLDAKGVALEPGTLYAVIFSNENQMQTYDLLFDSSVIGDTAYCDGTMYENPADSNKTSQAAFWKGQDSAAYGPVKCITSIGNVVGTCIPSTTSPMAMFEGFLKDTLANARTYSGKDDQTLLDDTAAALGLKQDDIEAAIKNTGAEVDWKKTESKTEAGSNPDANKTPGGGTAGGSADGGSSNGGSSNGGSTSTTGTKTGTGSTTKTGPETTVLYIMLGVMIAAAGVVVVARKRENA